MNVKRERIQIVIAGLIIGVIASLLVFFGNPSNMGFCIACFLRDTAGGLGLHRAAAVQYIRPEIIGLVLGAFVMSVATKEFRAKAGSSPATRFVLGAFVMIGALAFLGCPLRMVLRLGGGIQQGLLRLPAQNSPLQKILLPAVSGTARQIPLPYRQSASPVLFL